LLNFLGAYFNWLVVDYEFSFFFAFEFVVARALRFKIHGMEVSEFGGKKVTGVSGRQPPNLDFVIEKDNIIYGVTLRTG
jgi:hypothetical protein